MRLRSGQRREKRKSNSQTKSRPHKIHQPVTHMNNCTTTHNSSGKRSLRSYWKQIVFVFCAILTLTSWISGLLALWPVYISNLLALIAAAFGGVPIVALGVRALLHKDLDVDFLASIAIVAALVVGQYLAAAVVVLMLTGGQILEEYTARRTSRAIEKLVESAPKVAIVRRNGEIVEVPIGQVGIDDVVVVKPGEKIPVDGVVVSG